jgi:hypothetical protein
VEGLKCINLATVRLVPMEDFFPRMTCHLKYFETVDETIPKMHDFILEFYNTKFYFVSMG